MDVTSAGADVGSTETPTIGKSEWVKVKKKIMQEPSYRVEQAIAEVLLLLLLSGGTKRRPETRSLRHTYVGPGAQSLLRFYTLDCVACNQFSLSILAWV